MRKTLLPDEVCIKEAHFHGFYLIEAIFLAGLCALLGWGLHYAYYFASGIKSLWPVYIAVGIGFWVFLCMLLKKWTTEIILTNKRLIHKRGLFLISIDEVDIEQLVSDTVQQSMMGRLLDYGAIHITCLIARDLWLPPIRRPYEFRNAVEKQKGEYRERYGKKMNVVPAHEQHGAG